MTGNEIRALALRAVHRVGRGHIGGVLSCADILATVYSGLLRPHDRFLLGKGHAAIGLYAALVLAGVLMQSDLDRLNNEGTLGEEPNHTIPGVHINAGSLGHGLSLACGFAYADKLRHSGSRTYVLLGDGDCLEGATWEAAMFGAHHDLNITAILDYNALIIGGTPQEISGSGDPGEKFEVFGWDAIDCNGHDTESIDLAIPGIGPRAVIAHTVKGKGVSFMEGRKEWHHGSLTDEQLAQVLGELK